MVAINIKNEEAVRLIKELAELKGESMTTVVVEAVREKLERDKPPRVNEERERYWIQRGAERRANASPEWLAIDIDDLLYDEDGLPK